MVYGSYTPEYNHDHRADSGLYDKHYSWRLKSLLQLTIVQIHFNKP